VHCIIYIHYSYAIMHDNVPHSLQHDPNVAHAFYIIFLLELWKYQMWHYNCLVFRKKIKVNMHYLNLILY